MIPKFVQNGTTKKFDSSKPVTKEQIDAIISYVQNAPNSFNAQSLTMIQVTDPAKRKRLADGVGQAQLADAGALIFFMFDYNRIGEAVKMNGGTSLQHETIEAIISGSVDVGIALGTATMVIDAMGLAYCPIGFIRANPKLIIDELKLPKHVFPVVAMAIGHPIGAIPAKKPRLPRNGVFMQETYDSKGVTEALVEYKQMVAADVQKNPGNLFHDWFNLLNKFMTVNYAPEVLPELKRQGYSIKE